MYAITGHDVNNQLFVVMSHSWFCTIKRRILVRNIILPTFFEKNILLRNQDKEFHTTSGKICGRVFDFQCEMLKEHINNVDVDFI